MYSFTLFCYSANWKKKNIISLSVDVGCKQQFMLINARSLRKLECDQTVSNIQTPQMHARFAAEKINASRQAEREEGQFCSLKKKWNFSPTEITEKRMRYFYFPSLECVRRRRAEVYNEGKRIGHSSWHPCRLYPFANLQLAEFS